MTNFEKSKGDKLRKKKKQRTESQKKRHYAYYAYLVEIKNGQ